MFCPRCGQQQAIEDTRFCSRCGFLMQGMMDVVAKGGLPKSIVDQADPSTTSPRKRGIKQGGILMLSSLIIIPLVALFVEAFHMQEEIIAFAAIFTFWGGFLRIMYAIFFQSKIPTTQNIGFIENVKQDLTGATAAQNALPPQQSQPIPNSYMPPTGNWKETNDLQPNSVVENTTRTLNKKEKPLQ